MRSTAAALLLSVLPAPLAAGPDAPLVLVYPVFEEAVPHIDLPECPPAVAAGNRFCRLTLGADALQVWVFSVEGDQPLVALARYPAAEVTLGLGR